MIRIHDAHEALRSGKKLLLRALLDEHAALATVGNIVRCRHLRVDIRVVYATIFGEDVASYYRNLLREREVLVRLVVAAQDRCLTLSDPGNGVRDPQAAEACRMNELGPLILRLDET